ncbi:cytochrome c [Salipiger bermudensis]|uniref:c-type cytochrome n=1 Tax=Salipiger bermudensis TaxID=344736 RepID=UPI001C9A14F9|nr:cytochrome c [Salipiger bermudensis]MBY6002441.1 cytochrome c [Salipiger bermudensis]
MKTLATIAGVLALALPFTASADEAGEIEYMNHCAACHGESGMGDGPLAELMTVPVPDLTQVSAQNDGVFPLLDMIQVVDGRTGIRGHGYPMPVWGKRFKSEIEGDIGAYASEIVVRGRILSLAYYLESIQAE